MLKKTLVSLNAPRDTSLTPSVDLARSAVLSALNVSTPPPVKNAKKERSSDLMENAVITALMVQLKLTLNANFANLIRTVKSAVIKT
jgi:hypothetical protein